MPPLKEKIAWPAETLARQALQEGAEIRYHVDATKEIINSYQPYAVILAYRRRGDCACNTGIRRGKCSHGNADFDGRKEISGEENCSHRFGDDGIRDGGTAADTGETELPSSKWRIKIAPGAYPVNADDVVGRLKKGGARFMPGRKLEQISPNQLHLSRKDGVMESIATDATVLSIGVRSKK